MVRPSRRRLYQLWVGAGGCYSASNTDWVKGALNLWDVPPEVLREICRQLPKLRLDHTSSTIEGIKLRTFRSGDKPKRGEGLRIGTTRRPPRGVRKNRWQRDHWFDVWFPALAPSKALLERFKGKGPDADRRFFDAFEREIFGHAESRQAVALIAALALRTPISIGCFCEDETRCHRSRLFTMIEREAKKMQSSQAK